MVGQREYGQFEGWIANTPISKQVLRHPLKTFGTSAKYQNIIPAKPSTLIISVSLKGIKGAVRDKYIYTIKHRPQKKQNGWT